jgi:hypothetical protein
MNADPVSEPAPRTDENVLGRLAAIEHRLHQISTQLTSMSTLPSQLEEVCTNLETLIGSLRSVGRS